MPLIRWTGLREASHIDGVFRYPDAVENVSAADAQRLTKRGLASKVASILPSSAVNTSADIPLWVVIPTRNRSAELAVTLRALLPQKPAQVVIVDDGSTDDTRTMLAREFLNAPKTASVPITLIALGERNEKSAATSRNVNAARQAGIELVPDNAAVIELDDHDTPSANLLQYINAAFAEGAEVVYGDITRVRDTVSSLQRKEPYRHGDFAAQGHLATGPRAYKKSLYNQVGGYRPDEFPAGDYALMLRLEAVRARIKHVPQLFATCPLTRGSISVRYAPEQAAAAKNYRDQARAGTLLPRPKTTAKKTLPKSADDDYSPPDFSTVREEILYLQGTCDAPVDIVIPCYNSAVYLPKLLATMFAKSATAKNTMKKFGEITLANEEDPAVAINLIIVIDGDNYDPTSVVRLFVPKSVGVKVIRLSHNTGFAHAVNVGAKHSFGKYLLMLNADVTFPLSDNTDSQARTKNSTSEKSPSLFPALAAFMLPLLAELNQATDIAAAGGLQLDLQGRIHSCGSAYSLATESFEHLYKDAPRTLQEAYVQKAGDRDMLTGSCLLLKRTAWDEVGGLDESYRIGYWEDTDLCLALRHAGYRLRYTPASVVIHEGGHSGASGHQFYQQNKELFHRRWVESGLVERYARRCGQGNLSGEIVACIIILNEEEYIAACLEAVYELADRIVIVEGGVTTTRAQGLTDSRGGSLDETIKQIESVPDPDRKITLLRGSWPTKDEMREAYTSHLNPGDWLLMLDGDEILLDAEKWRLLALMQTSEQTQKSAAINFPMHTFWNDFHTLAIGIWGKYRPPKCVRWEAGMHYLDHNSLVRADGRAIGCVGDADTLVLQTPLAMHYAYVKPLAKLRRKIDYYASTTGSVLPDYFDRVFLGYRDNPAIINQFGSHPFGLGGVAPFTGEHPEPIRRRLKSGQLGGANW